jgi:hypothetical protein
MRFLFFRITNGVYSLPSAKPESITVINFLCYVLLTSTDVDPAAQIVVFVSISIRQAMYI